MGKIRIVQIRSAIHRKENQKRTVRALGIRKLNQAVIHEATPQIRGMVFTVKHLVEVEELDS
jgi:large subunit ribosomal protein L30